MQLSCSRTFCRLSKMCFKDFDQARNFHLPLKARKFLVVCTRDLRQYLVEISILFSGKEDYYKVFDSFTELLKDEALTTCGYPSNTTCRISQNQNMLFFYFPPFGVKTYLRVSFYQLKSESPNMSLLLSNCIQIQFYITISIEKILLNCVTRFKEILLEYFYIIQVNLSCKEID